MKRSLLPAAGIAAAAVQSRDGAGRECRGNRHSQAGVGVALLAVLVPLLLTIGRRIDSLAADVAELRRDLHALAERVARIEGALTGPWRPANGTPAPA